MRWMGERLRTLVSEKDLTQEAFSDAVGVSRQTYADWAKGQIPRGNHLLAICRVLDVEPASLFDDDTPIVVPAHRTRRTAKRTPERDHLAIELASEYLPVFDGVPVPPLLSACPAECAPAASALAAELRRLAGVTDPSRPLNYEQVFRLLDRLGLCAIFRVFPSDLKDYAFYTRLGEHRAVFVNSQTNVLDLIYPLLHEAVHGVRDTGATAPVEYSSSEEAFCEDVASLAQFPAGYLEHVRDQIKGRTTAIQVNTLKTIAMENHHVVYGLVKAMEKYGIHSGLEMRSIHGADGNLRKSYPALKTCLTGKTAEDSIATLRGLSPYFLRVLQSKAGNITLRTLGSLLDTDNLQDAKEIRELMKEPDQHACVV